MSKHERMARIDGMDLDTGAFTMTLATEGEASDGDILSIKGGQIPERMPMLTSHWNDPSATLGSITDPVKLLKDSPPRLRAVGHIEMGGEGVSAEIRRDLAHMIDKGHVTGVSIRWDEVPGKPPVRRVNLPSDHPYFVDAETEKDRRKRYGLYWEQWRGMEGSVVALGADPQALIGRAEELESADTAGHDFGPVATFWRGMAADAVVGVPDTIPKPEEDAAWIRLNFPKKDEPDDESPAAKIAASLAALRCDASDCREAGASHADCINAVTSELDGDIQPVEVGDFIVFLSEPVATLVRDSTAITLEPEPEAEESVIPEEMESVLERLEALEERVAQSDEPAALEEGREADDPPPSPEPERVEEGAPLPPTIANPNEFLDRLIAGLKEAHERVHAPATEAIVRPSEVSEMLDQQLRQASERVNQKFRAEIKKARGEVSK